jgi:hypothetical protein
MTTPEDGIRSQIRNIEAQYGRPMSEWTEVVRSSGAVKHTEVVAMLKADHGMSHGSAHRVALVAREAIAGATAAPVPDAGDPADQLYAGRRAALRPLHDLLMATVTGFGDDVAVAPKKGYVSLRRRKQFAMIQPGAARVDVGLILAGTATTDRLEAAGSFNALFTHRVRVSAVHDVDGELTGWLREAYDRAG